MTSPTIADAFITITDQGFSSLTASLSTVGPSPGLILLEGSNDSIYLSPGSVFIDSTDPAANLCRNRPS